jgi:hypothetical protein
MARDPAVGFLSRTELDALFQVLRTQAFTRELDDVQDAPRDGPGLAGDAITVVIDDTAIEVKQPAASCDAIVPKPFVTPKLSSTPCRAAARLGPTVAVS